MEPVVKMTPFCKNFCIAEKFSKKCNLKGFDFHKLKIMLFAIFQKTTNNVAYFFETLGFQQKYFIEDGSLEKRSFEAAF